MVESNISRILQPGEEPDLAAQAQPDIGKSPRCTVCARGLRIHLTGLNTVLGFRRRNNLGRRLRTG